MMEKVVNINHDEKNKDGDLRKYSPMDGWKTT